MKHLKLSLFGISLIGMFSVSCEFEEINYQQPIPVALKASDITSSGFSASWNPVEGGESYAIIVSTDNSFSENSIVNGYPASSNKTKVWVGGLEADQMYYYKVQVDNENSRSEYSSVISARTLALAAPQVITPDEVTPLSFVARWQSVPEAEGYLLYVSTNANFTEHLPDYNGKLVSDTVELVDDLKVNEDYFYRVRTVRGKSTSQTSALMRASTSQLSKPSLLDASETGFTSITINWNSVEGATSYKVFVGTDRFVITDLLPEYSPRTVTDATSLVVVGLNANTTYYYRVQATNQQSESENSEIGSTGTSSLVIPVAQPGTDIQIDGFQANWDSVANASSYVLDISRNESFTDFLNGYRAKEVVDTFEVVTGLLRNTNYYYRIRSKGFGAVSANSEVITVQTTFFASPKALEAIELQPTSFRAVWRPVAASDSYRIDVANDANFENILPNYNNLAITDTTQLVTGLTENERYFYRVRALKGSVFSGYSNIIDLTTTRLSEPNILTTTNIGLRKFTINWQPVTGAVRYRVDVGTDPSVVNKIATDYDNRIVNGTSLEVVELDANTVYYFKVRAENNVSTGGSSLGSARTVSINPPVVADPTDEQLTSFQANWSTVADAESYLLDVAIDPGFNNLVAGFNARGIDTGVFMVVDGLQPNTTYYYRVRAKGLGSNSDYSGVMDATTLPLPSPIVSPATNQETYQFTANWQKANGADKYLLYVATDPSFSAASTLSTYNGKEVLGNSHVVTGLDPYVTYYYRLQSKQASTVSEYSENYATVSACVSDNCRLSGREFKNLGQEDYVYSDGFVQEIRLSEKSSGATVTRVSEILYNGLNRIQNVKETNSSGGDRFWKFIYEDDGTGEPRIKNIVIEQSPPTDTIVKITFTYNGSNEVTKLLSQNGGINGTDTTFNLLLEENYSYGSNKISVTDENNVLVKELTLGTDFNTESLLFSDLALLMFNPTDPGTHVLPFITKRNIEYYEYLDKVTSTWKSYSYTYEYNAKRVPVKVRRISNFPELTYQFSGCD